jgi:hypothetical protein
VIQVHQQLHPIQVVELHDDHVWRCVGDIPSTQLVIRYSDAASMGPELTHILKRLSSVCSWQ